MDEVDHGARAFCSKAPTAWEMNAAVWEFTPTLPKELRYKFREIYNDYSLIYGEQGSYDRMHGRTVSQIIAEFQPNDLKPVVEGQVGCVRFQLFNPPTDQR